MIAPRFPWEDWDIENAELNKLRIGQGNLNQVLFGKVPLGTNKADCHVEFDFYLESVHDYGVDLALKKIEKAVSATTDPSAWNGPSYTQGGR